jgi:hypothetical protein
MASEHRRVKYDMSRNIFTELMSQFSPHTVSVRGEEAHAHAVKFLEMLAEQVPEEDERKKLMATWMRSIKERNYKKFERALSRYHRRRKAGLE